jgi:enoyl-CoA hydratase/carnithine racemase
MNREDIIVTVDESIGTICINRPDRSNTVRPATLREIAAAVDELTEDSAVKVIVLRAEGKHFSAGADFTFLDELTRMSAADISSQIYAHFQGAARRIYHCPKPTLALVAGAAVTVGCELALACDFRIAADDAFFQESWIKLGLMPPLGGLFLLPRLIGLGRASEMVLQGRAIKAEEALRIGLVSEAVPRAQLLERGSQLALELAGSAPLAYSTVKVALHRGLESSMESEWAANLQSQTKLLASEDFRIGLAAVKERKSPLFQGR